MDRTSESPSSLWTTDDITRPLVFFFTPGLLWVILLLWQIQTQLMRITDQWPLTLGPHQDHQWSLAKDNTLSPPWGAQSRDLQWNLSFLFWRLGFRGGKKEKKIINGPMEEQECHRAGCHWTKASKRLFAWWAGRLPRIKTFTWEAARDRIGVLRREGAD